ncbi:META domain-containing protein [Niabella aurantiaca]|uniref:META domain-containing protein n=1 Tax=Niabella aurantiaca TaxID=379900 RepID=UPI000368F499|nr:META domain-containing protein [Niabella aurantiaca]
MKIKRIYPLLLTTVIIAACSRNTAPLVSTLHTEALHHKWEILEMSGQYPEKKMFLDLRDVARSGFISGSDTLVLTPRFGHHQRMELDMSRSLNMIHSNDAVYRQLLKNVYRFSVDPGQISLFDRQGRRLLRAGIADDDEMDDPARKWNIIKLINAPSDSLMKRQAFIDLTSLETSRAFVGCNQIRFVTKTRGAPAMTFSNINSANGDCKTAGDLEYILAKALPLAAKYQVIGNRLKLFDKEDVLLLEGVADAGKKEPPAGSWNPLRREWMLKKLEGADGALVIESRASINLTDLARTGGMAGCNKAVFATSTGAGTEIGFSSIAATKKFCAEFMKVENAYLKVLPQIRSYMINGHFIKFKDAAGRILAEGVAADWD